MKSVIMNTVAASIWGFLMVGYFLNSTDVYFTKGWFLGMLTFLLFFHSLGNALEAHVSSKTTKEDTN